MLGAACAGVVARRTVRLVKGPRGQMMDARKVMGWITAADGSRAVCPRCEGAAFIRLSEVRGPSRDPRALLRQCNSCTGPTLLDLLCASSPVGVDCELATETDALMQVPVRSDVGWLR